MQRILTFLRDDGNPPACIEYSWVPTGIRHHIQLSPGEVQDSQTADYQSATNVQVYVLTQGDDSAENWQLPSVGEKEILHAVIAVSQRARKVTGTVFYSDASSSVHTVALKFERRRCPTA